MKNLVIATNLKRYNSAIYSVKELIKAQKIDDYEHLIDTIMLAYYGIEGIITDMEIQNREELIKQASKNQK